MPVTNEAKRALLHSRVLVNSLNKYLENERSCSAYTIVENVKEAQRANQHLLDATIEAYGLNWKLLEFNKEN